MDEWAISVTTSLAVVGGEQQGGGEGGKVPLARNYIVDLLPAQLFWALRQPTKASHVAHHVEERRPLQAWRAVQSFCGVGAAAAAAMFYGSSSIWKQSGVVEGALLLMVRGERERETETHREWNLFVCA